MKQKESSLALAAAKSGMSEKTAARYLKAGKLPSQMKKERHWRTRQDPFDAVWPEIERMLKVNPTLQSKYLFDYLCRNEPGTYQEGQLRTLQRRVKKWRISEGPAKEVMFPQVHYPGVQCQSDYTWMNDLGVTIANQPFDHLFYHFVLSYSNWEWGSVCFSESLESLKKGVQEALWTLGGVPKEHRSDNLTAAVINLQDRKEFNENYLGVMNHYGLKPSRNNPGKGHENGDVEQSHHRFKQAVDQELMLRGSRDFENRKAYEKFLKEMLIRRNQMRSQRFAEELKSLRELPARRLEDYTESQARVSKFSTISVRKNVYSVNSRLIGEKVKVRLSADHLEIYFGGQRIERLPRLRGEGGHQINYRHVIKSLVKKPGAFANYKYQADLYPRFVFRLVYDWLRERKPAQATKDYLNILTMAAEESEEKVDRACRLLIREGKPLTYVVIREKVRAWEIPAEDKLVREPKANLKAYDGLLGGKYES